MAFDEVSLPLHVRFGARGGPAFSTDVVVIDSGYERRNQNWSLARRVFDARTGLRSVADVATLHAFFLARAGKARGFRLRDWNDYSSASDNIATPSFRDQALGTGDGTTTIFQLTKNYTSGGVTHIRPIAKPVSGSILIGINGTNITSGWGVDTTTGLVTFAAAPASGQTLTTGFLFDVPVRFDTDQLSVTSDSYATSETDIPIVEIRI